MARWTFLAAALALPAAAQDPADQAEAAFRRIEARLRASKTLALGFRSVLAAPGAAPTMRAQGSLHWAAGGRMRYDIRLSSPHSTMEWPILAVTDGAVTRVQWPTSKVIRRDKPDQAWRGRQVSDLRTSPDFREHMVRQLAAFGLSGPALPRRDDQLELGPDGRPCWSTSPYDLPFNRVRAADFRGPAAEEGLDVLTFKVRVEGLEPSYDAKLWYEPKTLRLVRRTLALSTTPWAVITETYEDWSLDGDVPPDTFTLPPKTR